MSTQIIVKAAALGHSFMACCDYSPAEDGGPVEPPTASECIVQELSVNVSGMWLDCTWLLSGDMADQITDAIEANSDAAAKAAANDSKADAAEQQHEEQLYAHQ